MLRVTITPCSRFQKLTAALCVSLTVSTPALAGNIKAHVYDGLTKEQLIGANVTIRQEIRKVITSLDGGFIFKELPNGTNNLEISYIGYTDVDNSIVITGNARHQLMRMIFI